METEEERQARRRLRIEQMKKEKRRVERLRKCIGITIAMTAGFGGCFLGLRGAALINETPVEEQQAEQGQGAFPALTDRESDSVPGQLENTDFAVRKEFLRHGAAEKVMAVGANQIVMGGMIGDGGVPVGGSLSEDSSVPMGNGKFAVSNVPVKYGIHGNDIVFADSGVPVRGGMFGDGSMSEEGSVLGGGDLPADRDIPIGGMSGDGSMSEGDGEGGDGNVAHGGADGEGHEGEAVPALGMSSGSQALFTAHSTENTVDFDSNISSLYGVMIDVEEGTILAGKDAMERMNPASMTKILTVLVAAEHLQEADLEETVTITVDITDYCYINDCSVTGYSLGETVTIRDLFYGTILPSGADSAVALAEYVAGSQEAFVALMNNKLEEMGLGETTHFTNCVGLYDEEHYSTAYDIARILKAAVDNEFCKDVLSMHIYTTSFTEQHPEGLRVSNMFLRRIEDMDTHGEVLCAKTGYVGQSGNCAASFSVGNDGKTYLCVTAGASSSKNCLADQAELYRTFIP